MGSGLTGLGMKPGDEVTAEQMKYLFEQVRHPLSDLLIEALARMRPIATRPGRSGWPEVPRVREGDPVPA